MKNTDLTPAKLEKSIKTLLKMPDSWRARLIFEFLGIKRFEVVAISGRSKGFVSEVFNRNQKSRPLEEKAYELLQRRLKELCPGYCPGFEEVFGYDEPHRKAS